MIKDQRSAIPFQTLVNHLLFILLFRNTQIKSNKRHTIRNPIQVLDFVTRLPRFTKHIDPRSLSRKLSTWEFHSSKFGINSISH
jgi:hypothetical protein